MAAKFMDHNKSNDDGDSNESGNRFDKQSNNFACEQAFYTFLSRRCATVT